MVSGLISNKSPSTAFASFSAIFSVTFPADAEKYATSMLIVYSPYYSICLMIIKLQLQLLSEKIIFNKYDKNIIISSIPHRLQLQAIDFRCLLLEFQ